MGWWGKRNKKRILARGAMVLEELIECCDGKSNPIKFFSADEILKATNSFSKSNRLSGLEIWYSGKNENHHKILVKKCYNCEDRSICRDIAVSSMVSGHKNFMKLIGCCLEFRNPVMVYDGVKKHYKLDISEQPWKRRMKITEDIATTLAYLHTAFPRPFVYRCMSLGNILLDEDGVAKLSDLSYCVSIPEGETFVHVDSLVGLHGYMDYKYLRNGVVSEKTDVFAFGMLMQTFLTGRERFWKRFIREQEKEKGEGDGDGDGSGDDSITMAKMKLNWILRFMEEGRVDEIADPKMGENSELELCQMKAFLMLSLRCVGHKGEVPTMVEVAKELKKIQRSLKPGFKHRDPYGETQIDYAQDISSQDILMDMVLF
ncbi:hypothetical protein CARUB_v10020491mg [Capsella rubella]|uniref:Protein kinase domain-containing protein n=1 Tax=Capsella rubella TaxID=81985 RepID=R0GHU3_9BRAS|nr:inactive serine/threonine-protein kinase At1g67470 [Capsella rubella]EOA35316.1 hypothetical protein CARUB_v10020491mg [Capsella rubella]